MPLPLTAIGHQVVEALLHVDARPFVFVERFGQSASFRVRVDEVATETPFDFIEPLNAAHHVEQQIIDLALLMGSHLIPFFGHLVSVVRTVPFVLHPPIAYDNECPNRQASGAKTYDENVHERGPVSVAIFVWIGV